MTFDLWPRQAPQDAIEVQVIDKQYVPIGKVSRPHGIRGELKVYEGLGSSGDWHHVRFVRIGPDLESATSFEVVRIRRWWKVCHRGPCGHRRSR